MGRIKSFLKIEGTLDDLTFYKSQDGFMVRTKGGVSSNRIKNDPAFIRTRENGLEFGHSAKSGKQLRQAIIPLLADAKDGRVASRLTQVMSKIKNEDLSSARGQRQVAIGLATAVGKTWLKGFEFNNQTTLGSVLLSDYSLDPLTGTIVINDFIPSQRLQSPEGATHVSFSGGFLNLDFATGSKQLEVSNVVNLAIDMANTTVTLTPASVPSGTGNQLYFLKLAFFQELNGVQYPLNNGAFNALQLIDVL